MVGEGERERERERERGGGGGVKGTKLYLLKVPYFQINS